MLRCWSHSPVGEERPERGGLTLRSVGCENSDGKQIDAEPLQSRRLGESGWNATVRAGCEYDVRGSPEDENDGSRVLQVLTL